MKNIIWSKLDYGDRKRKKDVYHYFYYKKEELGSISYFTNWEKWIWEQNESTLMGLECLEEVVKKLKLLNKK